MVWSAMLDGGLFEEIDYFLCLVIVCIVFESGDDEDYETCEVGGCKAGSGYSSGVTGWRRCLV